MPAERRGVGRWRRVTQRGGATTGRECPTGLNGPDTLGPAGPEWNRSGEPHVCCGTPGLGVSGGVTPLGPVVGCSPIRSLRTGFTVLFEVRPPTGEPDAGNPPVRFGGRGSQVFNWLSLPLSSFCPFGTWWTGEKCGLRPGPSGGRVPTSMDGTPQTPWQTSPRRVRRPSPASLPSAPTASYACRCDAG